MGFSFKDFVDPGRAIENTGHVFGLDDLNATQQGVFDPIGIFSGGRGGFIGDTAKRIESGDSDIFGISDALAGNNESPLDWLGSPLTAKDPDKRRLARGAAKAYGLWALGGLAGSAGSSSAGAGSTSLTEQGLANAGVSQGGASAVSQGLNTGGSESVLGFGGGGGSGSPPAFDFEGVNTLAGNFEGFGSDFDVSGFAEPSTIGSTYAPPDMGLPGYGYTPGKELSGDSSWMEILKRIRGGAGMKTAAGGLATASGLYGLVQAHQMSKLAKQASERQDPFGPERAKYAQELSDLRSDPSKLTNLPGYKAGLQAVERRMASQGYLGSGNMMTALQQHGGTIYDQEIARLSRLAGADFAPSGGNTAIAGKAASNDMLNRSLASLGYGAMSLWRGE